MTQRSRALLGFLIVGLVWSSAADADAQRRRRRRRQPATGTLTIESSVEGAEVLVDEEPVGFTPMEPTELAVGSHTVRVRRAGYTEFAGVVEIRRGRTETVSVEIMALSMVLTVRTTPDEASVFVDGTFRGTAPIEMELSEGDHSLRITAPRHHEVVREVTAAAGQTELLNIELEPLPQELLEPRAIEWYEEPLTWVLIGAGAVVVVAALIAIIVVATEPSAEDSLCQRDGAMGCDIAGDVSFGAALLEF